MNNMEEIITNINSLENISKNLHLLLLPSTLWGVHLDPNYEFIAILHIQLVNTKLIVDKGVLVTYDEQNQCIKTTLLIHNEVMSVPSFQYTVQTISDLSELLFSVHHLSLCKNSDNPDFSQCMKYIKSDNFQKLCSICELQSTEFYSYDVNAVDVDEFNCNPEVVDVNVNGYSVENTVVTESNIAKKTMVFEEHLACTSCNKLFTSAEDYNAHLNSNCQQVFKCETCNETFLNENDCSVHKSKHDRIFHCQFCHKKFSSKIYLKEHIRLHTGERPYTCKICNKSNSHRSTHRKHCVSHSDKKLNLCNVCGKTFCREYRMEDHMLTHSAEKLFECTVCSKRFVSNHNLKIHEKGHSGARPYICKTCGKSYTTPSNLSTHIKSAHSKKKPHQCGVCDMSFLYPQLLKIHMRKHTGEKPYKCPTCGKGFAKNIHLTVHTRTHTGEKPYICSLCGKGFTTTGNLTSHKRVHTKEGS